MCTVTYIPIEAGKFVLTSNRDEGIFRPTSSPIAKSIGETTVFFPKDEKAGGTWIAAGENGRVCCLLNGAFEKHERKPNYLKSRGKIILESFEFDSLPNFFQSVYLNEVEPFTLIVSDNTQELKLYEFRWDGSNKHLKELNVLSPKIWSSATLYSKKIREDRENWFNNWLNSQTQIERDSIMSFHSFSHGNDPENDVIMERADGLKTVSITQIEFSTDSFNIHYCDLLKEQKSSLTKGIKRDSYA